MDKEPLLSQGNPGAYPTYPVAYDAYGNPIPASQQAPIPVAIPVDNSIPTVYPVPVQEPVPVPVPVAPTGYSVPVTPTEYPAPVPTGYPVPVPEAVPISPGMQPSPVSAKETIPVAPPVVAVDETVPEVVMEDSQCIEVKLANTATIDEERLRQSMLDLVSKHCCWGKRAATDMKVTQFSSSDSYHCQWITFMEKRWISQACRPFDYGMIDNNGIPPSMYDMVVRRPNYFTEDKVVLKIPFTESVSICSRCDGRGRVRCTHCEGAGSRRCSRCSGSGHITKSNGRETCFDCRGRGRITCNRCDGCGVQSCSTCNTTGKVIYYNEVCDGDDDE